MVLSDYKKGDILSIVSIQTDLKIKNRLQDMGLTKDVRIKVMAYYSRNAYILSVRGSRVVLAKDIAAKIEVEPIATTQYSKRVILNDKHLNEQDLGHCS